MTTGGAGHDPHIHEVQGKLVSDDGHGKGDRERNENAEEGAGECFLPDAAVNWEVSSQQHRGKGLATSLFCVVPMESLV